MITKSTPKTKQLKFVQNQSCQLNKYSKTSTLQINFRVVQYLNNKGVVFSQAYHFECQENNDRRYIKMICG